MRRRWLTLFRPMRPQERGRGQWPGGGGCGTRRGVDPLREAWGAAQGGGLWANQSESCMTLSSLVLLGLRMDSHIYSQWMMNCMITVECSSQTGNSLVFY
jgi:hypothetical protein